MTWIPCSERMPEKRDAYYLFGGYTDDGVFVDCKYHVSLDGRVNGWTPERLSEIGFTHWQPLPAPPISEPPPPGGATR